MLFTPIIRPLDLLGTSEINLAVNERHVISGSSDRIFVPQLGPFFKDSMKIRNSNNGELLEYGTDYKLLHMLSEATDLATQEINSVVYILDETISEVLIEYQAIGGKFAEGSIALIEIINTFKNSKLATIKWVDIIGLPDVYPVTPHKHNGFDIVELEKFNAALTNVYDAIAERDVPKFALLYENVDLNIDLMNKSLQESFAILDQTLMRIESNVLFREGDILVTDSPIHPKERYGYGEWAHHVDTFLYGKDPKGSNDIIVNISDDPGNIARKTHFWEQLSEINDISYIVTSNKTNIDEGESVTFTLRTTGLPEGSKVDYVLTGVTAIDIEGGLITDSFVVDVNGLATVDIKTTLDRATEGNELMYLQLKDFTSIRVGVTIRDTSRAPTYSIVFTSDKEGNNIITDVNEGTSFYVHVKTTELDDGKSLNVFYNGSKTDLNDFNSPLPTSITLNNNIGSFKVDVKDDIVTEGNENLVVTLSMSNYESSIVSNNLQINDTSKAPVFNIQYSLSNVTIGNLESVNEGVNFFACVLTENVPNGTELTVSTSGAINNSDIDGTIPSTVTINNARGYIPIKLREDQTSEGNEILTVNLALNGNRVASKNITIIDTSTNPNAAMKFSTNSSGSNTITSANEGDVVYLIINTVDVPNGTEFNVVYEGSATDNDFDNARPVNVKINNNTTAITFNIKADNNTDGDKELIVRLMHKTNGDELSSATLNIVDSSKTSTYSIVFSKNNDGSNPITTANEGDVIYAVLKTTDISDNTVMYFTTTIGGVVANIANGDVITTVATSATVKNNLAYIQIQLAADNANEGNEDIVVSVSKTSGGSIVVSNKILLNDTSVAPAYTVRVRGGDGTNNAGVTSSIANTLMCGGRYALVVETQNIPNGTILYLRKNVSGTLPSGKTWLKDTVFNTGGQQPSTSATVQNGVAIFRFNLGVVNYASINSDNFVLGLSLYGQASGGTAISNIITPVLKPTFNNFFCDTTSLTPITYANEGTNVRYVIEFSNIAPNTPLTRRFTVNNSTAVTDDIGAPSSESFKSDISYRYIKTVNIKADSTTEGRETLRGATISNSSVIGETSLSIEDTSRASTKLRAGVTSGELHIFGDIVDSLDPSKFALFVCPEGQHEAWTSAVSTSGLNSVTVVHNRSGTSRIGYSGNVNWMVVALEKGNATSNGIAWQAQYHNEINTKVLNEDNATISLSSNASVISPYEQHEAWTYSGGKYTVHNRSGANRISYSGKTALTTMYNYNPFDGTHKTAKYPRIVMAGTTTKGYVDAYDLLKYNLSDTSKYAIFINPLVNHEGWTITRGPNRVSWTVWDRSGTNRNNIPNANVSYCIVQLKGDGSIDNSGKTIFYKPGNYTYMFKKDRTYKVTIVAGGGAGGNAVRYHAGATPLPGDTGANSSLSISNGGTFTALGGKPGTRGSWNNGSAYSDGSSGDGGDTTITGISNATTILHYISDVYKGGRGTMGEYNVGAGGINSKNPERNGYNYGGRGVPGSGSRDLGFGGSGGAGGIIETMFKSLKDQNGTINIQPTAKPFNDFTEYYQSNWHYAFGEGGGGGMVIIEEIAAITITTTKLTVTANEGTNITRGYNLAEEFKKVKNRYPTTGDTIDLIIPSNWYMVGSDTSTAGITIDTNCNAATAINITNNGYILGRGSDGEGINRVDNYPLIPPKITAGPGIRNTSTKTVIITNYGTISGGGGGGARSSYSSTGGGGAPFGKGGVYTNPYNDTRLGVDATLSTAGKGGVYSNKDYAGDGGEWGMVGKDSLTSTLWSFTRKGTQPGYIKIGNVNITNLSNGKTIGLT